MLNWLSRKRLKVKLLKYKSFYLLLLFEILVGIRSNKTFGGMEYESFVKHTQLHLRNANTRFCSEQAKDDNDDNS